MSIAWEGSQRRNAAYLDVGKVITLHGSDATALVEADLPHAGQISQKIADAFAIAHIPHLQSAVRARDDLLSVVLEAGDCTSVRTKRRLASTALRVPDAQSTVCGGGDQTIMAEVEKANK
jgi:hypothetical protein